MCPGIEKKKSPRTFLQAPWKMNEFYKSLQKLIQRVESSVTIMWQIKVQYFTKSVNNSNF